MLKSILQFESIKYIYHTYICKYPLFINTNSEIGLLFSIIKKEEKKIFPYDQSALGSHSDGHGNLGISFEKLKFIKI